MTPIRETRLGKTLFIFLSEAWMVFAVVVALTGDQVTSRQWTYLMGVPGGQLFWAVLFAAGSLAALLGVLCHLHRLTAAGLFICGFACTLIASFYVLAPLIDPGLHTIGYVVWFVVAIMTFFAAVVSWMPIQWF